MPTLFGDYLRSGGDIFLIYKKENTQKCGWRLSASVEVSWRFDFFRLRYTPQ